MGGVGGVLKCVALVLMKKIPECCVRQHRGWSIISQTLSENSEEMKIIQS